MFLFLFFKAPTNTISSIKSIFIFFKKSEEVRKISWINWDTIFLKKENDGLGVRRIMEFNLVLLDKWCWRVKVG